MAGSRSYVLTGAGALLHNAVLRMAQDFMIHEQGFTPMTVPVLVREASMRGTGFFPAGREQAYRVGEVEEKDEDIRYLTGTGEVADVFVLSSIADAVFATGGEEAGAAHGDTWVIGVMLLDRNQTDSGT